MAIHSADKKNKKKRAMSGIVVRIRLGIKKGNRERVKKGYSTDKG